MQNPRPKVVVQPTPGRPAEREPTLSGLSARDIARPWSPSAAEVRTNRLLAIIIAATALSFAVVAAIGFQLVLYLIRGGPGGPTGPECVESDPDRPCPAGQFCQLGKCQPEITEDICDLGDPCGAKGNCTCEQPMLCTADKCVAPGPGPETPIDVCDNRKVQEILAALNKECKGNLGKCAPGDLKKFAITYDGFDELMATFPGSLTVHFPDGRPYINNDTSSWPDTATRDFYLERIRRNADALREAKAIFIIARSSPHGDSRRNGLYAQRRSIFVKEWLHAALAIPTAERDAFDLKLRDFILGHKRRLDRDFFAERYSNRFVTWDKNSRNLILKRLKAETLTDEEAEWLDRTINQVVLIVPVPCELKPSTSPATTTTPGA